MNIAELFEKHNPEYGKFMNVYPMRSFRPDLNAFLLLDELFPSRTHMDIVATAHSNSIYLNIAAEDIKKLTSDQVLELTRCGVLYCGLYRALYMNV